MDFISIKSFDEYQHYKDRNMIWFKWHIGCLSDYKFTNLKDRQKWLFIGLICLACKTNNKIPKDYDWIKKQISYESSSIKEDIDFLLASKLLAGCYQNAILDKIREDKIREEKDIPKQKYGEFVFLTEKEFEALKTRFGETEAGDWISRLDNYIGSKGKKYKSHYKTILVWADRDKPKIATQIGKPKLKFLKD